MLSQPLRVLYFHGFASSPASRKATFFAQRLGHLGFEVEIPDLAEGNFKALTISGQLRLAERIGRNEPLILIGSSLGGYLAALYAARHPEVQAVILLAPAFQFYKLWTSQMSQEELVRWKQEGSVSVFHYGERRQMPIGFGFLADASRFEPFPDIRQPTLMFHGNSDSVVPVQLSVDFSKSHPNAHLIRLTSGHELTDVLSDIWRESEKFLLQRDPELEC